MDRSEFVRRWEEALEKGSASAFIGAGLSRSAGYPDWRALLKDVAHTLGLNIDNEHDLAAVAQYSINRATGKRHDLSRLITNEFPPKDPPEAFRLLARLPLRHVWTTNYDALPEEAWRQERKLLDVKSRNGDLGIDKPWAHTILYKMHGSVDHPADVVIAKDDYELYRRLRPGFLQVLTGHLVSKQFLFLGFSFTDPNLAHLFGSIRESFKENGPEHYAIVRRPKATAGQSADEVEAHRIRHTLWVEDLQRYGIRCIEIEEFSEIEEILQQVATRIARRSIMVAGAYPDTLDVKYLDHRRKVEAVARGIGGLIAHRGKRLVSGFGLVVGSAALSGALAQVLKGDAPNLEKSLMLRPFPQEAPPGMTKADFSRRYREGMIQQSGACIVIAGEKDVPDKGATKRVLAEGVFEEVDTAHDLQRPVIPIGATGGVAQEIWKRISPEFEKHWPISLRPAFDILGAEGSAPEAITAAVGEFLDHLAKTA